MCKNINQSNTVLFNGHDYQGRSIKITKFTDYERNYNEFTIKIGEGDNTNGNTQTPEELESVLDLYNLYINR